MSQNPDPPRKKRWSLRNIGLAAIGGVVLVCICSFSAWSGGTTDRIPDERILFETYYPGGLGILDRGPNDMFSSGYWQLQVVSADGSQEARLTHDNTDSFSMAVSPDGGQVAFVSTVGEATIISSVNTDGSGRATELTSGGVPAWSPDGRQIAFARDVIGGQDGNFTLYTSDVFVMNADGTNPTNLTTSPGTSDTEPAWSPSGKWIAYISLIPTRWTYYMKGMTALPSEGTRDLYVMKADGSDPVLVTNGSTTGVVAFVWSPDSQRLFFQITAAEPGSSDYPYENYTVGVDGSGLIKLGNSERLGAGVEWSPDGRQIAFVTEGDGSQEIFVSNADGSKLINVTHSPGDDTDPHWSPAGKQIVFVTDGDGNQEIYVVHPDGSGLQNLSHDPANQVGPAWSPDGKWIDFVDEIGPTGGSSLYVVGSAGGAVRRLAQLKFPAARLWSPDSQRIAYTSYPDSGRFEEIFLVQVDGSNLTRLTNNDREDRLIRWLPAMSISP